MTKSRCFFPSAIAYLNGAAARYEEYNFLLYEGGDDFDDQVGCTLAALFVQFSGIADYDKVKLYYFVIIKF
jgi:hypothetical protein